MGHEILEDGRQRIRGVSIFVAGNGRSRRQLAMISNAEISKKTEARKITTRAKV